MIQASQSLRQPGRDLWRYITCQSLSQVWTKWLDLSISILISCMMRAAREKEGPQAKRLYVAESNFESTERFLITFLPTAGLQFFLEGGSKLHNSMTTTFSLKDLFHQFRKFSPLFDFLVFLFSTSNCTKVLA